MVLVMTVMIKTDVNAFSEFEKGVVYSFLNPYSMGAFLNEKSCSCSVVFFSDGWLSSVIFSILLARKVKRKSFDDTSLAPVIFLNSIIEDKKVAILGGDYKDIDVFVRKVKLEYEGLNIVYSSHGFMEDKFICAKEIILSKADVVILGLGTPLQEELGQLLLSLGYDGLIFTCGGYISQKANSETKLYYPKIISDLNLRALYRFYKEPHTRKRYLIDYPKNIVLLFLNTVKIRLKGRRLLNVQR